MGSPPIPSRFSDHAHAIDPSPGSAPKTSLSASLPYGVIGMTTGEGLSTACGTEDVGLSRSVRRAGAFRYEFVKEQSSSLSLVHESSTDFAAGTVLNTKRFGSELCARSRLAATCAARGP